MAEPIIVSATEGPMPETVEQLKALKAQGATSVDVRIINAQMIDDAELLELVELEIRDLAEQNGLTVHSITRDPFDPVDPSAPTVPYGPA